MIKGIRMNVIYRGPSWYNLCTVHSLKGRMMMNLSFCSLHLVFIKSCESKPLFCNLFCNLFYCARLHHRSLLSSLNSKHFMDCISICILFNCNFEAQVRLCVAHMNHYFCTCFVHLIKKNMLCPSYIVIYSFFVPFNATGLIRNESAHGLTVDSFLTMCL